MKQLLDFPKSQRLRAYRAAGNRLLEHDYFSCLALDDALEQEGDDQSDVGPLFWGRLFGGPANGTVETCDASWSRYEKLRDAFSDRTEANELREQIGRDALQTRLMMLAWAHAVDEAGDLEDILS